MQKNFANNLTFLLVFVFLIGVNNSVFSQNSQEINTKSNFWSNVQFGGGIGLGFGNGYTNIMVAPSGIYNFNQYVSAGLGLQYSYVKDKGFYQSNIYGGSIIGLFNPIPEIQLSTELEQLRVNTDFETYNGTVTDNFWNTALFLGAGYRTNNITIGLRYNVLHKNNEGVYVDALMPFLRIYF